MFNEIVIDKLAYGGDGLARLPDGRAVFIPDVIPGERVSIRIVEDNPKYARAELLKVLEPSPSRIPPPCPHFGFCGGCHYQHIDYKTQLVLKGDILKDQLIRIGHVDAIPDIQLFPSVHPFEYRNVIQFHPTRDGKLGFKKRRSEEVFEIEKCLLPQPAIQRMWQNISLEQETGITRVEIRQNQDEDILVIFQGDAEELPEITIDMSVSMVHMAGDDSLVISGEDALIMAIRGVPFHLSAGAFFQVNDKVTEQMITKLLSVITERQPQTVLDLYAGVGLFSRFIAPLVQHLIAVESNPNACRDFVINLNEFDNVALYEGAAEQVLPFLQHDAQLAVCDPPRAGLHGKVVDAIGGSHIEWLVYISCDPATLARDIHRLGQKGFNLHEIALFDMFPQTYHFESMAILTQA